MAYLTEATYKARFGDKELTELLAAETGLSFSTFEADAAAEVDAYLVGRYAVPVASPPPLLVSLAADVLRYRLHDDRAPDQVKERYKRALEVLKEIRDGTLHLAGADPATEAVTSGGAIVVEANDRIFDSDTLDQFVEGS